jgi:DNA-binding transcriptional ArsR family regulator
VTTLRASQVETLEAIEELEGEANVGELASRLGKSERTVEGRLSRLLDSDDPAISYRYWGPSWDHKVLYRLTDKGRAELSGRET